MVRIFFNDTAGQDGVYVNLKDQSTTKFEMTLDDFITRLDMSLAQYEFEDVRDTCKNREFKFNQTFYDPKKWRNQMNVLYPHIKDGALSSFFFSMTVLAGAVLATLAF
jgi:hypothetical protein